MNPTAKKALGLWSCISIGIGGMIGAGIFSLLGIATEIAGPAVIFSFMMAGLVALLCGYSYAKLGTRYPSAGGPVKFLIKGYGDGIFCGGVNILLWVSYIVAIALYAQAFAAYFMTFFPDAEGFWSNVVASAIVLLFMLVEVVGAQAVGRSEMVIVGVKVCILLVFALLGMVFIDPDRVFTGSLPRLSNMALAAGMVFIAFQGFGLITNAAEDMERPRVNLPKALYISILIVIMIYVLVSLTVVGNLSVTEVVDAKDYAMAEAARPFMGAAGFTIIAIAALFSTSSAINATLYGGANVCYIVAKHGELPEFFERKVWRDAREGLFITTGLVLVFVNLLDLEKIAMLGSASFLIVYMAVNFAHLRLYRRTKAHLAIIIASILGCSISFAILLNYLIIETPLTLMVLVVMISSCFLVEWVYRVVSKRELKDLRVVPHLPHPHLPHLPHPHMPHLKRKKK